MADNENESHSNSYGRLSEDEKAIVDAIASFLAGKNTKIAHNILHITLEEIIYKSTINNCHITINQK